MEITIEVFICVDGLTAKNVHPHSLIPISVLNIPELNIVRNCQNPRIETTIKVEKSMVQHIYEHKQNLDIPVVK